MALFDAKDIARLKARIPDGFQPRDADGGLSHTFRGADSPSGTPALQGKELERHNLGQALVANPDAAGSNVILSGAHTTMAAAQHRRHEEEKREEERRLIDRLRDELAARLAALEEELRAIDERLEEIRRRREQIGNALEALDEVERLVGAGALDPSNAAHAALLRQADIAPDRTSGDDLAVIIAQQRSALSREDDTLQTEWNGRMKRRSEVETERTAVIEARREIEIADTGEARILAERRAQTVLGAQELGEAALRTDDEIAKLIAADAVGVSAQSEASNREVATRTDEFFANSDEDIWDDMPTNRPPSPG